MGEVRLDGGKLGRMGFRARPTHQNRGIGRLRRGNYYNAVQFGYDRHESESYLGNVGIVDLDLASSHLNHTRSVLRKICASDTAAHRGCTCAAPRTGSIEGLAADSC